MLYKIYSIGDPDALIFACYCIILLRVFDEIRVRGNKGKLFHEKSGTKAKYRCEQRNKDIFGEYEDSINQFY